VRFDIRLAHRLARWLARRFICGSAAVARSTFGDSVRRRVRLLARRLARRFGSAACPASCPTARLTVQFGGGWRGSLPDSSLVGSVWRRLARRLRSAACPASCLTARFGIRFGDGLRGGLVDNCFTGERREYAHVRTSLGGPVVVLAPRNYLCALASIIWPRRVRAPGRGRA
jgi:hypothetical protein